jgi:anti-anti-sigma factor
MLTVSAHSENQSVHFLCTGRLVRGDECELLKQSVLARQERRISLDLSQLDLIDAAGLGALIGLQHELGKAGRELILVRAPARVRALIRLVRLDEVFSLQSSFDACPV